MTNLSRIKWEPAYSVHVEILDAQHKKLFDTVNHLMDVFESGSADFLPAINGLIEYISVHFHQEHLVMMNAKYPAFLSHSKEHQKFIEKVEGFIESYQAGDRDLGLNMVSYMKEWVRDHTTKLDMQYAEFLLKNAPPTRQP
ncbi:MAG: bacteriohemerythrin [Deltaproteobacteria bacterium]